MPASSTNPPRQPTGAESALTALRACGVSHVFGIPGGASLALYEALGSVPGLRHFLTRHEQGAGHAACGYAQASGRLGVCFATSGPGATNLVTALMDAHMDSVPVLALTGQVGSGQLGTDAFQETDICSIVSPVTKFTSEVTTASDVEAAVHEAVGRAISGRPGPVLLSITKDALAGTVGTPRPRRPIRAPRPADPAAVSSAVDLLLAASRPVLYVGGGAVKAAAAEPLRALAEYLHVPVAATLMAQGVFPSGHRLYLGMPGMHGTVPAVAALQRADLILAVGARFDDRVTGELDGFAPHARIVQIEIDARELSRKRVADVELHADCALALSALLDEARRRRRDDTPPDQSDWWNLICDWRARYPLGSTENESVLTAPYVLRRLAVLTGGPRAIYTAGVGQHQMWAAQLLTHHTPRTFLTSGGAGTMGYAIPAALGAQAAYPDADVWAIDGDGCFQMTNQELATCVHEQLPIKVAVINNSTLGMVRQWQDLFYEGHIQQVDLDTRDGPTSPDITALALAYGCAAERVTRREDVDRAIMAASAVRDRPAVLEFVVPRTDMVWPMVPAGVSNDEILIARGLRPRF
ncbi:biosynthetic-type acetolactate synthase large subunit [Streptomyces cyaneofuscatus]|uniref:biosynthetic-type acetolactate synthase large subunit n=1 Tax=Streptomyces cyaneofuscatus TaxID=66883 RepID=UPI0029547AD4|nr:biosynthetic-type acetolactate synthase large subunit [Streptomyces cyaneofuscatus]WOP07027.1 biosynthetic-type acetolactate synthase large subunit [Streptomyces cyaneofuscatus]